MEPSRVEHNINFRRAMMLLELRINDPGYLVALWRVMGDHYGSSPWVERCSPWYKGIEELL